MSSSEGKQNIVAIMKAATDPLPLLALIVVVVEATFAVAVFRLSGPAQTATIIGMISVLLVVVVIVGRRDTGPSEVLPPEIVSLWTEKDIPISQDLRQVLTRRWNCRWTYRTPSGELAPYVDDRISIESVDIETGKVTGTGVSAYDPGTSYKVLGRVSKRRLMHSFYSSPPPLIGLSGMVILRISPMGNRMEGWWIGTGRKGGDIEGYTTWTLAEDDQDFQPQVYPVDTEAHHS